MNIFHGRILKIAIALTAVLGCFYFGLNEPVAFSQKPSEVLRTLEFDIDAGFIPVVALGLILENGETYQEPRTTMVRTQPNIVTVSVPFDQKSISQDAVATAFVASERGEVLFGDMKPVFPPSSRRSYSSIPICEKEKSASNTIQSGQYALLQSLVKVRQDREKFAAMQLAKNLSGELLTKLQNLEDKLGLSAGKVPLSSGLPSMELIDRLTRVKAAVSGVKAQKKRVASK